MTKWMQEQWRLSEWEKAKGVIHAALQTDVGMECESERNKNRDKLITEFIENVEDNDYHLG